MAESAKRSRSPLLLRWLALNLIRLFGVVAIAWAIGVQVALLIADVRGASNQSVDTALRYGISPSNSSIGSLTTGNIPLNSSTPLETQSASPILSQILKPTDIIDVPDTRLIFATLYPGGATPLSPSLPPGTIINLGKRAESPELGMQGRSNVSTVERYFRDSTVPNQTGGMLMRSSGLALGSGKIWVGTDMQRHFVSSAYRLPGLLLLCSGGLDILIVRSLMSSDMAGKGPECGMEVLTHLESQKNKGQLVANREVYLRYHIAQRFLFWTNVPMEAFYGNDSFGSSQGTHGETEKAHMSRARPYAQEYPTFARGGLDDPERQIPDINGEKPMSMHSRRPLETIDEEIENLSEEVVENTRLNARSSALLQNAPPQPENKRIPPPQVPAEIAALPDSIQKMWKGVQPRFAANSGTAVPQIQLQPSTPSTIAPGNQSIKFSRPDTMLSTSSASSAGTGRSAQERSRIIASSARAFPVPPERAVAHPRSRPKSHLVNRRMDDSRLMPPKKSALRRHSQFAPPPQQQLSGEEAEQTSETPGEPDDAQKRREEISRRSFVRFDLHRMSGCSTDSASSADSGLSDILPPKPLMTVEQFKSQPAEVFEAIRRSESDSSIYSGIVQEVQRIDTTAAIVTKRSAAKIASPSRLSYLLTDDSSPDSPFSDIFAAKPTKDECKRQSSSSVMTVSTVYLSADESTGKPTRGAPLTESLPSGSLPPIADEELVLDNFAVKKKKRMSHIAV
ncbi:hypothetical protein QFC21_002905 [Naganishia friedmannii]|uniref:Uncharacterized protein n=1 Tax=Naganishia friedmannii TaxID=89922 RepID=A0ACC2VSW5_9TREE|nr:hypothetical protein QFC21_002905 [Naganishia friedmannii]